VFPMLSEFFYAHLSAFQVSSSGATARLLLGEVDLAIVLLF